jgi:hypothetical protein
MAQDAIDPARMNKKVLSAGTSMEYALCARA